MKPKATKFRKYHRPKIKNYINHKNNLIYSTNAIIATQPSFITASQLEAITLKLKRILKRKGKIIHRVFPHQSVTKKPQEVRMGKGKGNVSHWVCKVGGGTVLFEIDGVSKKAAQVAFRTGSAKLPVKTSMID